MTRSVDRAARTRAGDEEWRLRDERDLLRRSLDDAALEHLAGDLTDEDYALLRSRDERRLAEVDAGLDALALLSQDPVATPPVADVPAPDVPAPDVPAPDVPAPEGSSARTLQPRGTGLSLRLGRPRRRWWLAALGGASVVAAALLLVLDLTTPRLPGQFATGSVSLNTAQRVERQLGQAEVLAAEGEATQAMQLYGDVLAEDPRQPVALAEWGWLDWRAATAAKEQTVAAEGASALEEAVRVDRRLFVAQYYLGVVLYDEGDAKKAVTHFASFLADKPTAKWLRDAAPEIRAAYRAAHEAVPAGVPDA
jgi:tetratricopeptide (TPR) repeat protein